MNNSSAKIKWQKPFIVLLIFTHLLGCMDWVLIKQPAEQSIILDKPKKIKIILNNGDEYLIYNPVIEQDSLMGGIYIPKEIVLSQDQQYNIKKATLTIPYNHIITIPLDDVKEVRIEKGYLGNGGAAFVIIILGTLLIITIYAFSQWEFTLEQ